ncbi:ATP-binding cassette sub-family C member 10-like isoform X2 [Apostichopus japonicus]|uniref:ATP-binding cassette sub-family C member 10-like isoform X2 n=1 Tax=Stichopus japonicus TaxID=307972 RepID=UPI003AB238F1
MEDSFLDNLCHSSSTNCTFWGENPRGHCFELLFFVVIAHVIFGFVSSIYINRVGSTVSPNLKNSLALRSRCILGLLIILLYLIVISLNVTFLFTDRNSSVAPIDFVADGLVVISWFAHVGYLWNLRKAHPELVRGHKPVIASWCLTLGATLIRLCTFVRQLWNREPGLSHYELSTCLVWVCLQCLYLLTLLPSVKQVRIYFEPSRRNLYPSINADVQDETEPLLAGRPTVRYAPNRYSEYDDLGVAGKGASWASKLTLWWTNSLMRKGAKGGLNTASDVFQLPRTLQTTFIEHYFKQFYPGSSKSDNEVGEQSYHDSIDPDGEFVASASHVTRTEPPKMPAKSLTLMRGLINGFGLRYFILGIIKFAIDILSFSGPLLLNALVANIETSDDDDNNGSQKGFILAAGLFFSTLIVAFLGIHFNYQINNIMLQIRAAVILSIYHKTLAITSASLSIFSTGEIVNFMSVDSDRIVNFCNSFHSLWSLPLQIGVALYLLHQQLGLAFLTGLGFAILLIPINKWLTVKIMGYSKAMMNHKDGRVKVMNEILRGIRVIKFYAWEKHFTERVEDLRSRELKSLRGIKYLDAMCVYFWATTPVLISILTFTTYAAFNMGHLTAAKVFTSVALFNMLIGPLNAFPWVINGVVESWVSMKRVQSFMNLKELQWSQYYSPKACINDNSPDTSLGVRDGYFHWERQRQTSEEEATSTTKDAEEDSEDPQNQQKDWNGTLWLENINLHILKGQLVGVIGTVGSGKSSLLAAITAEMTKEAGHICVTDLTGGFGLVSQESWIQHATVRENILFGNTFNFRFYNQVVQACALEEDFKVLPAGDETEVGENGVTLSGGQKARVSLARAVYQDKDIYLLDDPLSAVDAHVGTHLFSECIMGLLQHKTRILCTHHTRYLQEADVIIVMHKGRIRDFGPPDKIFSNTAVLQDLDYKSEDAEKASDSETESSDSSSRKEKKSDVKLVQDEEKETGVVKVHVYKAYWRAVGSVLAWIVLISLFLMQASRNISDWWLSYWVVKAHDSNSITYYIHEQLDGITPTSSGNHTQPSSKDLKFYLGVYGGIAAANSVFTLIRAFSFAYSGLCAAKIVHSKILRQILKAPIKFFDETPIGRIMNRFSSDICTIDEGLPFILNIFLAQLYGTLGALVVTCVGLPWFILVLIPIAIYYYFIQNYYRLTSRELKRIYSITMSPIYAHFSESLAGLTTIRALRASQRFKNENKERLETNQKARFSSYAVTAWLFFRLQMLGVMVVTAVAFIAVIQHHFKGISPGLVGLVLSYSLSITSLLINLVTSFTETEKNMISMERAQQYIDGVPSERDQAGMIAPINWPSQGRIIFKDICLRYRSHLPNALDEVTFSVEAGEKVGIVGRTGSGKSSLFLVLFRMVEIQEGSVTIDGIEISQLPLEDLRSRIAVIPQDPFLFNAPVRENLDPKGIHTDSDLWLVLDKSHLRGVVQRLGGLDAEVGELGKKFSVGQRQLLCLARAILTEAKILCIDEATASVDMETDHLLQQTIREEFADNTVLTIAHRIKTILNSDRVLVMNNGKVMEFSPPYLLLQDSSSYFYRLVNAS